ncbi:MAG TPA: SDR family oxidoreductase [Pyrinomonadaceae bacterium]|nr:SDR family oxidoreductase [Pyrinomonadaceae bacterium]
MGVQLKKLSDQTIVITGASSGIGLVTARMAARRGARLVLAARAEDALRRLTEEIRREGGEAIYVVADVGDERDVNHIAVAAKQRFGGFDTWINNAGVSIYGNLLEISNEDHRRLFETNFWGVVYGSQVAARHLRGRGGAIINVGSTLSDRAIPVQGMYSASKHAVKGFTDALRMELEAEGAPVSVTLIKPSGIDTPYTQHAKNYMESEPTVPPPVYAPETVAEAILHCCENAVRDLFVGAGGKAISASGNYAPRLTDRVMEATMPRIQRSGKLPRADREGGLHKASGELAERGAYDGHVAESSVYTKAAIHPFITAAVFVGAGLALTALLSPNLFNFTRRAGEGAAKTNDDTDGSAIRANSSGQQPDAGGRTRAASA